MTATRTGLASALRGSGSRRRKACATADVGRQGAQPLVPAFPDRVRDGSRWCCSPAAACCCRRSSTCAPPISACGPSLLTFETPLFRYKDFDRRVGFLHQVVEQVRTIPGVISAGSINLIPFTNQASATFYLLEGQPRDRVVGQVALIRNVSRDYFATVGARLREGRAFADADQRTTPRWRSSTGCSPIATSAGRRSAAVQVRNPSTGMSIVGVVNQIPENGVPRGQAGGVSRARTMRSNRGLEWRRRHSYRGGTRRRSSRRCVTPSRRSTRINRSRHPDTAGRRSGTVDVHRARRCSAPSRCSRWCSPCWASTGCSPTPSRSGRARSASAWRLAPGREKSCSRSAGRGLAPTLVGLRVLVLAAMTSGLLKTLLFGFRPLYILTAAAVSLVLSVFPFACLFPPAAPRTSIRWSRCVRTSHETPNGQEYRKTSLPGPDETSGRRNTEAKLPATTAVTSASADVSSDEAQRFVQAAGWRPEQARREQRP